MLQKLPVNGFKCVEGLSKIDEGFVKSYHEKSKVNITKYVLEADIQYAAKLHRVHNDFYLKEWKLKMLENALLIYMVKVNMVLA